MGKIFGIVGTILGAILCKYYFPEIDSSFTIVFAAGIGGMSALIGYLIDLIVRKSKKKEVHEKTNKRDINKFGGWLYLFAFSLFYQGIFNLKGAYDNYLLLSTDQFKQAVEDNSFWRTLIFTEGTMQILCVLLIVTIAYFCIKKSVYFKYLSISFIVIAFVFQVIDLFLMLTIENDYAQPLYSSHEKYDGLYRGFVYLIIWVPYFLRSKRVKNTYIKRDTVSTTVSS